MIVVWLDDDDIDDGTPKNLSLLDGVKTNRPT